MSLDSKDRIGAKGLLELVIKRKDELGRGNPLWLPLKRMFKGQPQGIAPTLIKPRFIEPKANFYYRSKTMFKEISDSLVTIIALVAFIILAIYLLNQDPALVGPI